MCFCNRLKYVYRNGLIMNWYYFKVTKLDIIRFWKEIIHISIYIIALTVIGYWIYNLLVLESIRGFISSIIVYTIIYGFVVYRFCMNIEEKRKINSVFNKVLNIV